MKEINMSKIIARKRKEKGDTQDDLAKYIGVSKASVSKWETGQSYPDITFLPMLATYFNISIDELMGYAPQMAKEDVKALYQKLSCAFTQKPFCEVLDEIHVVIKKYYSCFPLLLQMAALLISHCILLEDNDTQTKVLEEAITLCQRVKEESDDINLSRQANSSEAICNLFLSRPNEVVDLLSDTLEPISQDETTLASAFEMRGEVVDAKKALQISSYQHILQTIGAAIKLLPLYMGERDCFEEILRRNLIIAETFHLATLHPNAYAQFSLTAAYCLTTLGEHERALDLLEKGIRAYGNYEMPVMLHGDKYFNLLDDWFNDFALGTNAPQDEKTIKESLITVLQSPTFLPVCETPQYKRILEYAKSLWGNA